MKGSGSMKRFFRICSLVLAGMATSLPLAAQSPYSAAVTINGEGVTHFEIEQRALLLEALGTLGDVRRQARNDLIDDRLKIQAGRAFGLSVNEEELKAGIEEFTQRVNMKPEEFTSYLIQAGVEPETFTDFVNVSLVWRKVIGARFQSKAFITEAELDTAMSQGNINLGASVLLAEIVLPYNAETRAETLELAAEVRSGIKSFADFEDAALTFSASPTRANGGKMDWTPVQALPPDIAKMLLTMGVGGVTPPLPLPGAVAIFQLRGVRDNRAAATKTIAYDYSTLLLPGGRSAETLETAAKIRLQVDTCNDFLAVSTKYPEEYYSQQVTAVRQVPKAIAAELAHLDDNEISSTLTAGDNNEFLMLVMLCGRTNSISEGNREDVRLALFNQRMEAFGEGYLQELKGDAIIREK